MHCFFDVIINSLYYLKVSGMAQKNYVSRANA